MFQRKFLLLLICLAFTGQISAQVKTAESKRPEITDELKAKANNLLNSLAREADQFYLPENRVRARSLVASLLWEADEKQARQLFQNAVGEMDSLIVELSVGEEISEDEKYLRIYQVGELRKNLLLAIASRDPVFALSAFQSLSRKKPGGENLFDGDDILELELARQISDNDPQKALDVALKSLESGLGYGIFDALENIYKKDAGLGAKLAREILRKIKDKDAKTVSETRTSANANSAPDASAAPPQNSPAEITVWQIKEFADKAKKLRRKAVKDKKNSVLNENEYKELIEILARAYAARNYVSSYEIASLMEEIDAYFPALAQAIRRKLAGESANLEELIRAGAFEAEAEDKSIEEIIQIIEKKPAAHRDALYQKAAETIYNEGDIISAKQLYSKVKTKPEYDYLGDQIDLGMPLAMAEEGNIDEIRQILDNIKTPEEKINILTALSQSLAAKGDLKTAKELAEQARAVFFGKMKSRKNMASIINLSHAFIFFEPEQAFSFLENNISAINDIIAAGILIDEFNESGAVKNGEVLLDAVQSESYLNMPKGVALLRKLAAGDFERAAGLADRFARREAAFFARFRLAQALLDPKAEEIEAANQQVHEHEGC